MPFGSSKSKSSSVSPNPQQQAALASELIAHELMMMQILGGGSMEKNARRYAMEQKQKHQHQQEYRSGATHVIPVSAMPDVAGTHIDIVYPHHHHHHHHAYSHRTHAHSDGQRRHRHRSGSDSESASSSSSLSPSPSPTSTRFEAEEFYSAYPSPELQTSRKAGKGKNLKDRARALFGGH